MVAFNDRRNLNHLPSQEDYDTPLTKSTLAKANNRFRQSGVSKAVGTDKEMAATIVSKAMKNRRKGVYSPKTVGEYLELLNGTGE